MPAILPAKPASFTALYATGPDRVVLDWGNAGASGYILVMRQGGPVAFTPTATSTYTSGAQGSDEILYVGTNLTYVHSTITAGNSYHYAVYSYDANHFYSSTAATVSNGTNSALCSGLAGGTYILIAGDATYGTNDFCVQKYEAKNASGTPTSQVLLSPWVSITQNEAISECQSLGPHYKLISNDEWLTIASNIANVGSNWNAGVGPVGTGDMNRGHSDNSPASSCAASSDDTYAYVQTNCTPLNTGTWNQKRTHTLASGDVIWDFAGNVWDWTSYVIPNISAKPYVSADTSPQAAWRELSAVNAGLSSMPLEKLRPTHDDKSFWNDAWNSSQNIGQYYAGINGSGGVLVRGAGWNLTTNAGVLSATLHNDASSSSRTDLGFRCVLRPSSP
jgi:hypothetical protein